MRQCVMRTCCSQRCRDCWPSERCARASASINTQVLSQFSCIEAACTGTLWLQADVVQMEAENARLAAAASDATAARYAAERNAAELRATIGAFECLYKHSK